METFGDLSLWHSLCFDNMTQLVSVILHNTFLKLFLTKYSGPSAFLPCCHQALPTPLDVFHAGSAPGPKKGKYTDKEQEKVNSYM